MVDVVVVVVDAVVVVERVVALKTHFFKCWDYAIENSTNLNRMALCLRNWFVRGNCIRSK